MNHKISRNTTIQDNIEHNTENLSIFKMTGRALDKGKWRYMKDNEYKALQVYILLNCQKVKRYIK